MVSPRKNVSCPWKSHRDWLLIDSQKSCWFMFVTAVGHAEHGIILAEQPETNQTSVSQYFFSIRKFPFCIVCLDIEICRPHYFCALKFFGTPYFPFWLRPWCNLNFDLQTFTLWACMRAHTMHFHNKLYHLIESRLICFSTSPPKHIACSSLTCSIGLLPAINDIQYINW